MALNDWRRSAGPQTASDIETVLPAKTVNLETKKMPDWLGKQGKRIWVYLTEESTTQRRREIIILLLHLGIVDLVGSGRTNSST